MSKDGRQKTSFSAFEVFGAFLLGIIIAVPLGFAAYFFLSQKLASSVQTTIFAALGVGIGALLCLVFARVLFRKLLGHEEPSLLSVVQNAELSVEEFSAGQVALAREHASQALKDMLAVYAWVNGRKWLASIFFGAIALFAGGASTFFLIQQNALLESQNEVMRSQEVLMGNQESLLLIQTALARNSMLASAGNRSEALVNELQDVLTEIRKESFETRNFITEQAELERMESFWSYNLVVLSPELTERIEALTLTFRPYWYVDAFSVGATNVEEKDTSLPEMVYLSPERGLILQTLFQYRATMRWIEDENPTKAVFSYADMRGFEIKGAVSGLYVSDFLEFGGCQYMSGSLSMLPYHKEHGDMVPEEDDRLKIPDGTTTGPGLGYSMPIYIPGHKHERIDFSHSMLNGVSLTDELGTMVFNGARLTNVQIRAREKVDLSGAIVQSVAIHRLSGQQKIEVVAHDTTFRGTICPGENFLANQSAGNAKYAIALPEFIQTQEAMFTSSRSNFSGAKISEWLIAENHFGFADINASSKNYEDDSETDHRLVVVD